MSSDRSSECGRDRRDSDSRLSSLEATVKSLEEQIQQLGVVCYEYARPSLDRWMPGHLPEPSDYLRFAEENTDLSLKCRPLSFMDCGRARNLTSGVVRWFACFRMATLTAIRLSPCRAQCLFASGRTHVHWQQLTSLGLWGFLMGLSGRRGTA